MFRILLAGALIAFQPFIAPPEAHASCAARAAQVASQTGGRVVSVQRSGNNCRVRVVVRSGNGPPRSRVVVVRR